MILDGAAEPMRRIWYLYNISRAEYFYTNFQLITDDGELGNASVKLMDEISERLIELQAFKADTSNNDDKYTIHYRILNPGHKKSHPSFEFFKECTASGLSEEWFVFFDRHVCSLVASTLLVAGMKVESESVCLRAIGMGEEVTMEDLKALNHHHSIDMKTTVEIRDGNVGLAIVFAITGQLAHLKYVLWEDAEINGKCVTGATPLHYAVILGHLDVCGLLIKGGARIDEANDDDYTPLDWTATIGCMVHMNICEVLLNGGADVDTKNNFCETALHMAAMTGHSDICEVLLNHGADIDIKNRNNYMTALDYANVRGQTEVIKLLYEWRKI